MHSRYRLHDAAIAYAEAMAVNGFHPPHVRGTELRQGNVGVAADPARHARRPQQFVAQVAIHELVDVAQVLQQLPGLAERRRDQLDQRFGEIRRDVFIGEGRAQIERMRSLDDPAVGQHA
jgi:hypothetical protein